MDNAASGRVEESHDADRHSLLQRLMTISRAVALEEMASGIAHELNQPLGAIVTFSQAGERIVSRADSSTPSVGEVLQLIGKEAFAAAEGIRRIRKLFERASLVKASASLADVLLELSPVLELLGAQTGTGLRIDAADDLCDVSIDRLQIQHVLFTLVQNAFEAAAATSNGSVDASVVVKARGDRYGVEISVIDSGPGVSETHRAQIFHPFFTTKPSGTGLGLTSARTIVEAHQGTIGFENSATGGARFWFRLSASEPDEDA
jgi:two-component system sensor kinase FixL